MMRLPRLLLALLALALLLAWASPGWASEPTRGTVKSVDADQHQIVVTDKNNKDWTYRVLDKPAIFMPSEGAAKTEESKAKLSDLKAGEDVSLLWEKKDDRLQASAILVHRGDFKDAELAAGTIKNIGADNNQFTATDSNGKEWTFQMADNARLRLNNKSSKLGDFKNNEHVAIVYEKKGDQFRVLAMCDDPARAERKER
jgi:Cu/Ag efflux protein CusF